MSEVPLMLLRFVLGVCDVIELRRALNGISTSPSRVCISQVVQRPAETWAQTQKAHVCATLCTRCLLSI